MRSYYEGLRRCRVCNRKFYSDCTDICSDCAMGERYDEAKEDARLRIKGFKLTMELVPSTSWYRNLRAIIGQRVWDKVRYETYKDAGYRCSVCGLRGSLHCHEVWEYDDVRHIQTLTGLVAVCCACHMIKHIGYAGIRRDEGKLDYNSLIRHYRQVNRCSYDDFVMARDIAFEDWEARSLYNWTLELGEFKELVASSIGKS